MGEVSLETWPIFILSDVDKILEKLMHSILMKFLDDKKKLNTPNNLGFSKSFLHPIPLSVINYIQKCVDDKQITCWVYIDPEKALDTLDQALLLDKFSYYGIEVLQIDGSNLTYLSNRA